MFIGAIPSILWRSDENEVPVEMVDSIEGVQVPVREIGDRPVPRSLMIVTVAGALFIAACSPTVLELEVGTCFDDPDSYEAVSDVPVVDCDQPHDKEVFANEDLTGSEYPGSEQVRNRADAICLERFASYVGIAFEDSIYDIGSLFPTDPSWGIGDREVICFAYDVSLNKITGSINGVAE